MARLVEREGGTPKQANLWRFGIQMEARECFNLKVGLRPNQDGEGLIKPGRKQTFGGRVFRKLCTWRGRPERL